MLAPLRGARGFESSQPLRVLPRARAALCATLALAALHACRGAPEPAPEAPKSADELTLDDFRNLIQQSSLRPVEGMEKDPNFADPKPDAADDSFDAQARRVEESLHTDKPPPADATPPEPVVPEPAPPPENPYLRFGKRIMVYPDLGLIAKPYPLRVGLGSKLQKLLETYGRFPLYNPQDGPQKPTTVRLELLEKWDQELFSDLRSPVPSDGAAINIADWLIVTSGPELLGEVESFIDIFAAGVPQIEIEAKIVEVVTNDSLDLGIRPIDATTPIFGFPDHTLVRGFTYNLPNQAGAINSLLTLGAVQDGLRFNAVLQALQAYENVAIISRPKIAVREGGRASIVNTQKIPYLNVTGISPDGKYGANIANEEVGIKLFIVPRVVGTQTVALNIDIEASAQSGTNVTFTLQGTATTPGTTIASPVISRRAATTVVYLEPGQAVILGGLISERSLEQESKVPFLGDIPLIGNLFKSTYTRKEQTNVLFFIRPRILQGTDLNREF
jgi:type II secretory pathway component GspD/PulD (secretin)